MGGQASHLIQARKLCNSLSFIDDLNLTNDDGEYKVIYCNICGELLELCKVLTDKNEATFFEFNIDIKYGKLNLYGFLVIKGPSIKYVGGGTGGFLWGP